MKGKGERVISFIRGELAWFTENSVVVDCGGIGYEVTVPASVLASQPRQGEEIFLYTYLQVREDGVFRSSALRGGRSCLCFVC